MGMVFTLGLLFILLVFGTLLLGLPLLIISCVFLRRNIRRGTQTALPIVGVVFGALLALPGVGMGLFFLVSMLISLGRLG